jgi:TolB-like protein
MLGPHQGYAKPMAPEEHREPLSAAIPQRFIPGRAVFLSYASEDVVAAGRIATALRGADVEVWFDKSELRGGDAWDQMIRKKIKACALFIPIISRHAHDRIEGYFRLEWKLAVDRSHLIAPDQAFLVPVVIDDTPQSDERIPDRFRELQWTCLPGGATTPAFIERVQRLLSPDIPNARAAATPAADAAGDAPGHAAAPAAWQTKYALWAIAAALALVFAYLAVDTVWIAPRTAAPEHAALPGAKLTPSAASTFDKSIAVLPFVDLSEKHDQEYFSDGLAEELIDALTRVPQLRVPARTSSFAFKGKPTTIGEIARALAVTHVLEGSVRKSGERLRITAQLVRADSGFHLWSQTYDRETRDIFAIQDDIAQAVVEQLKITLLGAVDVAPKQTTSTEAHNLYLQARNLTDRDTQKALDQAVALYQRALEVDPHYAPAWAWLARCHVRRVSQGLDTTGAGYAKATTAATRAIEIDPTLPDPYIVLASAHLQYDLDWKAAQAELSKVAELEPNNAYAEEARGHVTAAIGRMSDSVQHFQRAVELDPLNLLHRKYLGRALHYARRSAESSKVLQEAIGLNGEFPGLHYELGRALLLLGKREEAYQAFAAEADHAWRVIGLPLGYWAIGRQREARTALETLIKESQGSEFQVAEAYGFFGDTDRCLEWLEKARVLHDPGVIYFRRDALLEPVGKDPRFDAFRERLGVPPVAHDD